MDADRVRQLLVSLAAVVCAVVAAAGPDRWASATGLAVAQQRILLAPVERGFLIWGLIYLGYACYLLWQWLPSRMATRRARVTGWHVAGSLVLTAGWLESVRDGRWWAAVGMLVVLSVVLAWALARLDEKPSRRLVDWLTREGVLGMHLGWTVVLTLVTMSAALAHDGRSATGRWPELITLGALAVITGAALALLGRFSRQWTMGLAMAWGLGWIGYARVLESPRSLPVAAMALGAAVTVLLGTVSSGLRKRPRGARPKGVLPKLQHADDV